MEKLRSKEVTKLQIVALTDKSKWRDYFNARTAKVRIYYLNSLISAISFCWIEGENTLKSESVKRFTASVSSSSHNCLTLLLRRLYA